MMLTFDLQMWASFATMKKAAEGEYAAMEAFYASRHFIDITGKIAHLFQGPEADRPVHYRGV